MRDDMVLYVMPTLLGVFYMLPTLVAYARDIPQRRAILVINVVVGWTLLGWVVASIWAMNAAPQEVHLLRARSDEF